MFAQSATCSGGVFRRRTTRMNVRLARIATTLDMWTSGVHFVLRCGTPRSGLRTCQWATRCVLLCGPTLLRTCLWATWGAAGHGGTVGSACAAADASGPPATFMLCRGGRSPPHFGGLSKGLGDAKSGIRSGLLVVQNIGFDPGASGLKTRVVVKTQGFDPGPLLWQTLGSTRGLRC